MCWLELQKERVYVIVSTWLRLDNILVLLKTTLLRLGNNHCHSWNNLWWSLWFCCISLSTHPVLYPMQALWLVNNLTWIHWIQYITSCTAVQGHTQLFSKDRIGKFGVSHPIWPTRVGLQQMINRLLFSLPLSILITTCANWCKAISYFVQQNQKSLYLRSKNDKEKQQITFKPKLVWHFCLKNYWNNEFSTINKSNNLQISIISIRWLITLWWSLLHLIYLKPNVRSIIWTCKIYPVVYWCEIPDLYLVWHFILTYQYQLPWEIFGEPVWITWQAFRDKKMKRTLNMRKVSITDSCLRVVKMCSWRICGSRWPHCS